MKKGFTLVELSIVLVIIGLLIGGILVAQSMIGTAKIQALSRQLGQFDAAVENFTTKYNQLPGDNNIMGAVKGNNDGRIFPYTEEMGKFWSDLSISGLTNPGGSAYADWSASAYSGQQIVNFSPKAVAGSSNSYVVGYGLVGNYYFIGDLMNIGSFKAADVLALDTKMDDGIADTGKVKGTDRDNLVDMGDEVNDLTTTNNCANAATYNVAATTSTCSIRVRMGNATGNLR